MIKQVASPRLPQFLLPCVLSFALGACGGGDKNAPVSIGKSVASYDISATVASERQALFATGAVVASVKCYPEVNSSPDLITGGRIPAVLYVFQVRARDLDAASTLGFKSDFSMTGFSLAERACATDPDTRANDFPTNDTPANPG
jgi:hypothetical protein